MLSDPENMKIQPTTRENRDEYIFGTKILALLCMSLKWDILEIDL